MQGSQPDSFKTYPLGTEYDLKPYLTEEKTRYPSSPLDQAWARLSHYLLNVYGLTARVESPSGQTFYLRSAPSAGGLYPTELYLISRGNQLLPAGLYNYQAHTHSLWQFWADHVWQNLQEACFWHPALERVQWVCVLTSVFQRSAWRYQDRAYRRVCLDAGHVLGNLEVAASLVDYRPHFIGGFADRALNDLLYLNEREEGAIAVVALANLLQVEQNLPRMNTTQPTAEIPLGAVPHEDLLWSMHQAGYLGADADYRWYARSSYPPSLTDNSQQVSLGGKYNFPFCLRVSTVTSPVDWEDHLQALDRTIARRRSTRKLSGAHLTLDELLAVLDFAYQPQHYVDQGLDGDPDYFDLGLIQSFVAVSGVEGLEVGCYYYAPYMQELRQIRFKDFREELGYLCLGQELGKDAAAMVFHTADLAQAIALHGDRAYRYLHLDAGHLGQRLNLAAIRLGLGVSGIGGFFDDLVNEVLGIPEDEAVIYITALGRPSEMLTTV